MFAKGSGGRQLHVGYRRVFFLQWGMVCLRTTRTGYAATVFPACNHWPRKTLIFTSVLNETPPRPERFSHLLASRASYRRVRATRSLTSIAKFLPWSFAPTIVPGYKLLRARSDEPFSRVPTDQSVNQSVCLSVERAREVSGFTYSSRVFIHLAAKSPPGFRARSAMQQRTRVRTRTWSARRRGDNACDYCITRR